MTDWAYGLHLGPNEYYVGDQLRPYLAEMRAMGMTATTTLNKDEYSFRLFREYGIETVLFRPQINCEQLYEDLSGVQAMRAAGLDARTQPYNEPSDSREWPNGRPDNYVETWSNRWIDAAIRIYHAGGYPGIQCLDPEDELRPLLRRIKETGNEFLLDRIWMSVHDYADSHPSDFGLRPERDGYDVYDRRGWLSFVSPLAFDRVFREEIGRSVDTYCTEGGWTVGDDADNRFPKVTPELHAKYTLEVVRSFKEGKLPDGSPWPRWWKGFTFWIIASSAMGGNMSFEANAWYYSQIRTQYNTLSLTIDGLKALSGGQPIRPTFSDEPPPVDPPPVPKPPVDPPPVPKPPVEEKPVTYEFDLDFKRYAEDHPELKLKATSLMSQNSPQEVVQHTLRGKTRGLLNYVDGQGTTYYEQYKPRKKA